MKTEGMQKTEVIRKQSEPHGHADFLVLLRRLLYDENQNSLTLRQLIFAIRYARKICGNPAVSVQLSSVFFYHLVYRECKSIGCFFVQCYYKFSD